MRELVARGQRWMISTFIGGHLELTVHRPPESNHGVLSPDVPTGLDFRMGPNGGKCLSQHFSGDSQTSSEFSTEEIVSLRFTKVILLLCLTTGPFLHPIVRPRRHCTYRRVIEKFDRDFIVVRQGKNTLFARFRSGTKCF